MQPKLIRGKCGDVATETECAHEEEVRVMRSGPLEQDAQLRLMNRRNRTVVWLLWSLLWTSFLSGIRGLSPNSSLALSGIWNQDEQITSENESECESFSVHVDRNSVGALVIPVNTITTYLEQGGAGILMTSDCYQIRAKQPGWVTLPHDRTNVCQLN